MWTLRQRDQRTVMRVKEKEEEDTQKDGEAEKICESDVDQGECCTSIPGLGVGPLNKSGTVLKGQCRISQLLLAHKAKEFLSDLREKATRQAHRRIMKYMGAQGNGIVSGHVPGAL